MATKKKNNKLFAFPSSPKKDREAMQFEERFQEELFPEIVVSKGKKSLSADEKVGKELLEGKIDPEGWAVALRVCNGDKKKAKNYYLKWRQNKVQAEQYTRERKEQELDQRRLQSFEPRTPFQRHAIRMKIDHSNHIFWEGVLCLSFIGIFLAMARILVVVSPYAFVVVSAIASLALIYVLRRYCNTKRQTNYIEVASYVATLTSVVSVLLTCLSLR